jgi:serine protease DegS
MDAILNEGNSGGALVDSNGNLLGINNAKFKTLDRNRRVKDVEGVSFAVPYALAKRVMEEVIANGKVTRGQLGFSGNELVGHNGILVTSVAANSPAYRAGLQPEDILVAINGEAVKSSATTLDLIAETSPGTTLKLQVSRREQLFDLEAVVTELVTQ